MVADTDEDGTTDRVLEIKKTNYGSCGEKVKLRWEDGSFVMAATASAPHHQAAALATADEIDLDCLDTRRNVFPMPGRGQAPKVFAEMEAGQRRIMARPCKGAGASLRGEPDRKRAGSPPKPERIERI
jgi:hypothetical protein